MFRIDNASAVAEIPAPLAAGTPGFFGRGDIAEGVAPTILSADWANIIQEELVKVIIDATGGGMTLDKENNGQLLAAILAMISRAISNAIGSLFTSSKALPGYYSFPGGFVIQFGRATAAPNASTTVVLPIAYDVLFAGVVINGTDDLSADAQDNWPTARVPTQNDRFVIRSADDSSNAVQWIAFGFRTPPATT